MLNLGHGNGVDDERSAACTTSIAMSQSQATYHQLIDRTIAAAKKDLTSATCGCTRSCGKDRGGLFGFL